MALHRIVKQLGIHRDIESAVGIGPTMLAGMGLVALSMVLMLRVTADADPLAREDLAFALSVVLLGLLVMVTRRNAVSQVVGFMSLENGLVLAATGAKGMPLVVEISVAFSILIAFIVIGIFLFRIRERFDSVDVSALDDFRGERQMSVTSFDPVTAVLLIPIGSAALLAALPGYRLTARLNVVASLATFLSALSLFVIDRPQPGPYVLIDDLNIVFIVLNTFVGFTTSIFQRELHRARAGDRPVDAGLPAFLPRHVPDDDVRHEPRLRVEQYRHDVGRGGNRDADHGADGRHLSHPRRTGGGVEVFHPRQRRHRLRAVRHDPGLHGGATGGRRGPGRHGLDAADRACGALRSRRCSMSPSYSCSSATGPRSASRRCMPGCPTRMPKVRPRYRRCCRACCSNVALYALLRFKILLAANPAAIAPGPLMVTMGLVSVVFAAFMLYRRRDIKRLFAYSSIEHMGIIVFAFGMGGPLANFAGLLHMVMHSLTKSAIFYAVGHISQIKGTQRISRIRGLTVTHPALGWGLVAGVAAIAGLPPLGIFMSEFLIVSSTFARQPLLAIVLVFGILLAFGALTAAPDQRRVRRTPRQHGLGRGFLCADVRASRAGSGRGDLSARAARRLVPARGSPSWISLED